MITNTAIDKSMPIGHYMAVLSKAYLGVLFKKLDLCEVDRYYMVVPVLDQALHPFTQQSLGDFLNVDKVSMVRIVDHLVNKGIVERVNNPDDRREKFVVLTPKGKQSVNEINAAFEEINCRSMAGFSEAEKKQFFKLMERMNENLCELPSKKIYLNIKRSKK